MHKNGSDSTRFVKKQDIYLVLFFLIIGLAAFFWMTFQKKAGEIVQVTVDGIVQGNYPLEIDDQIDITGEGWTNTLVIKDGFANMTIADCPDQICVRHKAISGIGETIVCLPHKVVVEVVSDDERGQKEKEFDVIAN